MHKIKPLGNRVLIKRTEAQKSKGGILLPETAQEKPKEGEVVAVGPGATNDEGKVVPLTVKVGDKVLFTAYSGTEVPDQEEKQYLILSEEDILAIIQ